MKSLQLFVILLLISFILFILFQVEWVETKEGLTNRTVTHEIPICQGQPDSKPPPCFATIQTDEYLGNSTDFIKDDYILKTKIVTPVCPNDPFMSFHEKKNRNAAPDINSSMFNEEDLSALFRIASDAAVVGNRWLSNPTNTENLEKAIPGVTDIVKNVINISGLTSNTGTENYSVNGRDLSWNTIVNITKNIWDSSTNILQNNSFPFIQSDTQNNQPQPSNSPTASVTDMPIPTLPLNESDSDILTPEKPIEPEPAEANETSSPQPTEMSSPQPTQTSSPQPTETSSPSIYRVPTGSPPIDKPPLGNPPWYSCNRTNGSIDPQPINDDFTRFTQI
jgi:hypothetical protein